jgi:hypothetical protein
MVAVSAKLTAAREEYARVIAHGGAQANGRLQMAAENYGEALQEFIKRASRLSEELTERQRRAVAASVR